MGFKWTKEQSLTLSRLQVGFQLAASRIQVSFKHFFKAWFKNGLSNLEHELCITLYFGTNLNIQVILIDTQIYVWDEYKISFL